MVEIPPELEELLAEVLAATMQGSLFFLLNFNPFEFFIQFLRSIDNLSFFLRRNNMTINTPRNSRVEVDVSGNTITITTAFNYSGSPNAQGAPRPGWPSALTYRTAFEQGIVYHWNGNYTVFGFNVTVTTEIVNRLTRRVPVEIRNRNGTSFAQHTLPWCPSNSTNHIIMYAGLNNQEDLNRFRWVAAHEFGHILGLRDWYVFPEPLPYSIMSDQGTYVQDRDVEAVIRAFATMERQLPRWGSSLH